MSANEKGIPVAVIAKNGQIGYTGVGYSSWDGDSLPESNAVRPGSQGTAPVTLEQWIALNDEIAALVRVGVPLEEGLRQLACDMPGRSGKVAAMVAEGIERGESLPQVLAAHPGLFPPLYRAVVEAGLKMGRLAGALESLAQAARRLAETRRMVAVSFLYPVLVFVLAWGLFLLFTLALSDRFLGFVEQTALPGPMLLLAKAVLTRLVAWRHTAHLWGPAVPLALLIVVGFWWVRSARATLIEPRATDRFLGWLPWVGRTVASLRAACMADVLGMLLEHGVPLDAALVTAAEAVGGPRQAPAIRQLAEALRRGEPLERHLARAGAFPPLMRWLMVAGYRRGSMAASLRRAAETYHSRARLQGEAARVFLPVFLTLAIGFSVTALYGLLVFGAWFSAVRSLM